MFLVALCFSISVESFKRFYESEDIHNPKLILVVGALGLLVNLLGLCLFAEHGGGHGHSHGGGGKKNHANLHKDPPPSICGVIKGAFILANGATMRPKSLRIRI